MDFQTILNLCDEGSWKIADKELNQYIRKNPDQPKSYAIAAHVILRQGNCVAARWLLNKAQALTPENPTAIIENICLDFYEAKYEQAYRKIFPALLENAPQEHPIFLIAAYLCCLYNDVSLYKQLPKTPYEAIISGYLMQNDIAAKNSKNAEWNGFEKTFSYVKTGDKLMACIVAKYSEMFFPSEANSYAVLGMFNLYAGFYENAARNFHEALFRKTDFADIIELNQFFLLARQQKFIRAIKLGFKLEKAGKFNLKAQAIILDIMLRVGYNKNVMQQRLNFLEKQNNINIKPYLDVINFRIQLINSLVTHTQVIRQLQPYINQPNCSAAYLYFYADLIENSDVKNAKAFAARALALEPVHPSAQKWSDNQEVSHINFEYAGLFIPKEHEGSAWPTTTQMELLEITFSTPIANLAKRWSDFTSQHSLYTLEAGSARLLPLVYKKLSTSLKQTDISQFELLSGIWKKSYFENALRLKSMLQIVKNLEEKGVEIILLKGMANALSLYDDIGSRPMSDIDILVSDKQIEQVDTELRNQGWKCDDELNKDRTRFTYAMTYRHHNGTIIDMHWRPCENLNADFYNDDDIGLPSYTEFMEKKWAILSPTINLLCTILHGVDWNHLSPVRWIADSLLILNKFKRQIDWQKIYFLAKKYHCMPILATGLKFLTKFNTDFVNELPKKLIDEINKDYENETLMKIRLRSYGHLASFDEAFTMLKYYKKRFEFNENDHLFICGGDKPEIIKKKCAEYNINWAPHYDRNSMLAVKKSNAAEYNFIVIDANLSCVFNCLRMGSREVKKLVS